LIRDYPADQLEAFVCDGMSDDKTREKVQALAMLHPAFIYSTTRSALPQALNLGIKNTDADIVIILGAHAELANNYVSECVKFGRR
jgi:glycosyltransferase involved in cell wall biosynthesis